MFFAITALGVSAIQIAIGIAIGLALRKQRRRRLAAYDDDGFGGPLPVDWPPSESDEPLPTEAAPAIIAEADQMIQGTSRPQSAQHAGLALAEKPPAVARGATKGQGKKAVAEPVIEVRQRNRRKSPRRPFEYRQQVAPYHGGRLPGKASFRDVDCQDISSTGFSFLSSQLPDFDSIVVALGVAPQQVYLWAHIVSRIPVEDGAAPLYRIGCRFVGPVTQ